MFYIGLDLGQQADYTAVAVVEQTWQPSATETEEDPAGLLQYADGRVAYGQRPKQVPAYAVRHLERIAAPRLTIVSCDPATLARDLAALPGYRIERITLVDLFPQTYHLETVVSLRLVE